MYALWQVEVSKSYITSFIVTWMEIFRVNVMVDSDVVMKDQQSPAWNDFAFWVGTGDPWTCCHLGCALCTLCMTSALVVHKVPIPVSIRRAAQVIVVTRSTGPAALTMTEVAMLTQLPVLKKLPSPISWTS